MRGRIVSLLLGSLALSCGGSAGEGGAVPPPGPAPFGLLQRIPVSGLGFPDGPPRPGQVGIVKAFPNLSFASPLFLAAAPGDPSRLYVVEKRGVVRVFDNDAAATSSEAFLDISGRVRNSGEQGLLGLAFDPDFQANRNFYLYYSAGSASPGPSVIARYTATSATRADPATEQILLQFPQPFSNHNGGMLAFGPDGKLYVGVGDGGSGGDPLEAGQDLTQIYGSLLRLERDGSIPADNPFAGQGGGARGEIWAYGLRNPWRFSFDRNTGALWCADVGQGRIEEIDLIVKGGNYGWDIFEGERDFENPGSLELSTTAAPLFTYDHSVGASITGGYVYRGSRVPSLAGAYLYGDYVSGRIWALAYDGGQVLSNTEIGNVANPASFGEDGDGEVYLCSFDGSIYRFEEQGGGGAEPFPQTLSATGLFADTAGLRPAPGLIEYAVNAPLWSDGARKRRWIALPGSERIAFRATRAWDFPEGTVLVKHFELELAPGTFQRLETRVLILGPGGWQGYVYRWNAAQTDADLLAGSQTEVLTVQDARAPGGQRDQTWVYPSRTDCLQCHTLAAGRVLGVRTHQLNGDFAYADATDNQLRAWNHVGLFTTDIGAAAQYEAYPDPAGAAAPLADRARAYLAVNCAGCHLPGGPTPATLDLRFGIAVPAMNAAGVAPAHGDLGRPGARILAPGDKEASVLWERLRRLGPIRMPPLGSRVVDAAGVDLVGRWIDGGAR